MTDQRIYDYLPWLDECEYPAILTLMDDRAFPGTYEGWLAKHQEEAAVARQGGKTVCEIPISSADFRDYLRATLKGSGTVRFLWLCAIDKAARNGWNGRVWQPT